MPANYRDQRRKKSSTVRREPGESRAAEILTIVWTVSVTGVLIADLLFACAHFLVRARPGVATLNLLEGMLLLSAATMGVVSLALFAAVWRIRQLKPPQGYMLFACLVAAAPIAAAIARLAR
jgi:hypothetical protein